jgi:hypothetical protein
MIRDYALDRLDEASEREEYSRRHAMYFVEFARVAGPGIRSRDEVRWTDRLEDELENVRAAVSWLVDAGDVDHAMEVVLALADYGHRLGAPLGATAGEVAAMPGAVGHPLRPVAIASAAWHSHQRDGGDTARGMAEGAVRLTEPEPSVARCRAFAALAGIAALSADPVFTVEVARDWLDMADALADQFEALQALCILGGLEWFSGEGGAYAERAVALAQQVGNPSYLAFSRLGLGLCASIQDANAARHHLEEARRAAVEARNPYAESVATGALGGVYFVLDEHELAARAAFAACRLADRAGHRANAVGQARALARCLVSAGQTHAGLLVGAWTAQQGSTTDYSLPGWVGTDVLAAAFDAQSDEEREALFARAADLDFEQVLGVAAKAIAAFEASTDEQFRNGVDA